MPFLLVLFILCVMVTVKAAVVVEEDSFSSASLTTSAGFWMVQVSIR